nr:MAG TPA: hypothetical protein [Caudoviricetes sp.]
MPIGFKQLSDRTVYHVWRKPYPSYSGASVRKWWQSDLLFTPAFVGVSYFIARTLHFPYP